MQRIIKYKLHFSLTRQNNFIFFLSNFYLPALNISSEPSSKLNTKKVGDTANSFENNDGNVAEIKDMKCIVLCFWSNLVNSSCSEKPSASCYQLNGNRHLAYIEIIVITPSLWINSNLDFKCVLVINASNWKLGDCVSDLLNQL